MNIKLGFIFIAFASFVFTSCEKNIDFVPQSQPSLVVVDANIEYNQPPVVVLTKTINFFSSISPQIAASSFINNAAVSIFNGTSTITLKEYTVNVGFYKFYYYSLDSSIANNVFLGEQGKKYELKIIVDTKEYLATTNIPIATNKVDSLWWIKPINNKDSNRVSVMGRFKDPKGLGNYIRYFTKTNSQPFLPGPNSAFTDDVIDGKTYSVQVTPGVDRNAEPNTDIEANGFFYKGDTVTLKFCDIDKATYMFWNTWEFSLRAIGNPFSSPNTVIGNVSNGALGAFCGYTPQYKTLIIPK
jgi:hypothetical protein